MIINNRFILRLLVLTTSVSLLVGCANLHQTKAKKNHYAEGAYLGGNGGLGAGLAVSSVPIPLGVAIGSAFGLATGSFYGSQEGLVKQLKADGAQVVEVGDTTAVYLPADQLFKTNTNIIKPSAYGMLTNVVELARLYKNSTIHITGHADNVASAAESKQLTEAQANSVAGYLWAEGVSHSSLNVAGASDTAPVANNVTIAGSGSNRHVLLTFVRPRFV